MGNNVELDSEEYDFDIPKMEQELKSDIQQDRINILVDKSEGSVLDCGACLGFITEKLIKKGHFATPIDMDDRYIEYMEKKGLNPLKMDVRQLNFLNKNFDTVIAGELFEHLENPGDGLRECCRVAKKKVLFTLPLGVNDPYHKWTINTEIKHNFLIVEMVRDKK